MTNDEVDIVVFHTIDEIGFDVYPDAVGDAELGESYKLIGIDGKGRPNIKSGVISKKRGKLSTNLYIIFMEWFINCKSVLVGFVIGDNHAEEGDSGAAIIDLRNWFIGMAIGKQDFLSPPYTLKDSTLDLNQIASHFSYAQIVPAQTILALLPREENEVRINISYEFINK